MPQLDRSRLEQALRAADAAGDTDAARRLAQELRAQGQQPFVGPVATGEEMARSLAPKTEQTMRKFGLLETAEALGTPVQRLGLGAAEAALSIGTGMVSAPINSFWNAAMEAGRFPTGQPAGTYQPRTQTGQAIVGGIGKAAESTGIPQMLEKGLGLNDPDPGVRATGNLINGVLSVAPGAAQLRRGQLARAAIPTRAAIKTAAGAAYDAAEASGGMLAQKPLGQFVTNLEQSLANEGVDAGLHPKTMAALNRLYEEGSRPGIQGHSVKGAEVIRRVLADAENQAIKAGGGDDARLAGKIVDDYDDFIEQQLPAASSQYGNARALWTAQRKAGEIEQLVERAKNQAGQFSVSGMDNALRTQFKSLADNPRRFNRFNAEEKAAILKVVRGGPVQNTLRFLGKGAIRGPVSGMFAMGAESLIPGSGIAVALGGEAARTGSALLRGSRAADVDRLVRAGALPAMPGARARLAASYTPGYLPTYGPAASNALIEAQPDEPRNALRR